LGGVGRVAAVFGGQFVVKSLQAVDGLWSVFECFLKAGIYAAFEDISVDFFWKRKWTA
jgi:hypothetical protein